VPFGEEQGVCARRETSGEACVRAKGDDREPIRRSIGFSGAILISGARSQIDITVVPDGGIRIARTRLKSLRGLRLLFLVDVAAACAVTPVVLTLEFSGGGLFEGQLGAVSRVMGMLVSALVAASGAGFALLALQTVDIEIDDGRVRLPFAKQVRRWGWRTLDEVQFASDAPTPERVTQARAVVEAHNLRGAWPFDPLLPVRNWERRGGLLVITRNEAIRIRGLREVGPAVVRHCAQRNPIGNS